MAEPFLIGEAMTGGYGAVDILHSCTLAVEKGEIAVIVGPNGAGKSTAMKAVFGMLKLRQGRAAGGRGHHHPDPAGPRPQGHGLRAADPTSSPR
jgi:ABC-type branched-subunit amino acid transport system ATPase component